MSKQLMKGNEALAEAALRAGCRFYSGYPITPQTEILEYLAKRMDEVGGTFVQTESELAGINMLLGAAAAGARALTSSAGPGFSLNQEGISYLVAADLPAVILNVMRIGTGLRTFTLTAGVQNYAFFVIPIIQMLFTASNDPTLGILFVHNVGCELVVWSIGVIIIAGGPGNLNMGVFFRGPLLAVTRMVRPGSLRRPGAPDESPGNDRQLRHPPLPDPVRLFHAGPVAQHEMGAQAYRLRPSDTPGTGPGPAPAHGVLPSG